MRTPTALGAAAVAVGLTMACGGTTPRDNNDARDARGTSGEVAATRPAPTIVTGCLTQADGRFAVTTLGDATETYQLINGDDQLRQYVGREVRVSGEAAQTQVADVRESTPGTTAPVGTSGQEASSGGASVSTQSQARLEAGTLSVVAVTPTGDECVEAGR